MKKFGKILQKILSGKILEHPKVSRYYPFMLFLVILALIWIANTYRYIHIRQEIATVKKSLADSTAILKKQETDFTGHATLSNLVEKLETKKIKIAHDNTYKIIVKKDEGGKHEQKEE